MDHEHVKMEGLKTATQRGVNYSSVHLESAVMLFLTFKQTWNLYSQEEQANSEDGNIFFSIAAHIFQFKRIQLGVIQRNKFLGEAEH